MSAAVSTVPPTDVRTATRDDLRALLDVRQVADTLNCSTRTVWTLRDAGKLPAPIRLGSLVRWRAEEIRDWVRAGCPDCRQAKGGRA